VLSEAWGEDKRLARPELVPVSQSSGLLLFSDISLSTSCVGGDAEVVTVADLAAAERADEANGLFNCLLWGELSVLCAMDGHRDGIAGVRNVKDDLCDRSKASPARRISIIL
jgi:hypothetical protein